MRSGETMLNETPGRLGGSFTGAGHSFANLGLLLGATRLRVEPNPRLDCRDPPRDRLIAEIVDRGPRGAQRIRAAVTRPDIDPLEVAEDLAELIDPPGCVRGQVRPEP